MMIRTVCCLLLAGTAAAELKLPPKAAPKAAAGKSKSAAVKTQAEFDATDIFKYAELEKMCHKDTDRFCHDIPQGDERVFRCLLDHKFDADMSAECKAGLEEKEIASAETEALVNIALCVNEIKGHPEFGCSAEEHGNDQAKMIECLRANLDKVTDPLCKAELFQVIKEQATDFRLDPTLHKDCAEDQKEICPDVKPGKGRVHKCLRKNFKKLSKKCLTAEFGEALREAKDVRLKPEIYFSCKAVMKKLCQDVDKGEGQMIQCLRSHADDVGMNARCKKAVVEDAVIAATDIELNPAMFRSCKKDIKALCSTQLAGVDGGKRRGLVIECLTKNVQGIKEKVCKLQVMRNMKAEAKDVRLEPQVENVCSDDIKTLCKDVTPGGGRTHKCLRDNFDKLSDDCSNMEFVQEQREARDVRLKVSLQPCANEFEKFCPAVKFGNARMINCMQDHRNDEEMSVECSSAVVNDMIISADDYTLKPQLYGNCKEDIAYLCSHEIGGTGPNVLNNGRVIECLIENAKELQNKLCKQSVFREEKNEAADVRLDPGVAEACLDDLAKFCKEVTPGSGRMHECLRENMDGLEKSCRVAEFQQEMRENSDVRLRPMIGFSCAKELKELCGDANEGGGKFRCLQDKTDDPKMGPRCKKALMPVMERQSKSAKLNPLLWKACMEDMQKLCPKPQIAGGIGGFGAMGALPMFGFKAFELTNMKCLMDNRDKIKSKQCQISVDRRFKIRSKSISLAPALLSKCKGDVKMFCGDVKAGDGKILACLQEHMKDLSPECKAQEFSTAVAQAKSIGRMAPIQRRCKKELAQYCSKVSPQSAFSCLKKLTVFSNNKGKVSAECRAAVKHMSVARSRNIFQMPAFAKSCAKASATLCPDQLKGAKSGRQMGALVACLIANKDKVEDINCKSELFAQVKGAAENIELNAHEQSICSGDEKRFCSKVKSGSGRMHVCLRKHYDDLTPACRTAEFAEQEEEQADVRLVPNLENACQQEIDKFCKLPKALRSKTTTIDSCLVSHLEDEEMGPECRKQVEANEVARSADIRLRPLLFKRCAGDERELCAFDPPKNIKMGGKFVKVMHGKVMDCMVDKHTEIKDPMCQKDVVKLAIKQVTIPMSMSGFAACKAEIAQHCEGKLRFQLSTCLVQAADAMVGKEGSARCSKVVIPQLKSRMRMKNDYERKVAARATQADTSQQYHGIVLTGNLAMLSIFSLVSISIAITYFLWKKIANPTTGKQKYTRVAPKKW